MKHIRNLIKTGTILLWLCATTQKGMASPSIQYEISPLGGDYWKYTYHVSGYSFNANDGFSIYFDYNTTTSIDAPTAPNADWDMLVLQPDTGIPADGVYDGLALNPSSGDTFTIDFHSTAASPGAQFFDIYSNGGSSIVEAGLRTTPFRTHGVPDAGGTGLLLSSATLVILVARYSRALK